MALTWTWTWTWTLLLNTISVCLLHSISFSALIILHSSRVDSSPWSACLRHLSPFQPLSHTHTLSSVSRRPVFHHHGDHTPITLHLTHWGRQIKSKFPSVRGGCNQTCSSTSSTSCPSCLCDEDSVMKTLCSLTQWQQCCREPAVTQHQWPVIHLCRTNQSSHKPHAQISCQNFYLSDSISITGSAAEWHCDGFFMTLINWDKQLISIRIEYRCRFQGSYLTWHILVLFIQIKWTY